jgi:hypothetical protein
VSRLPKNPRIALKNLPMAPPTPVVICIFRYSANYSIGTKSPLEGFQQAAW